VALNLYLAIQFGGDGKDDFHLLVRGSTVEEAAQLADERFSMMPGPWAEPCCNRIIQLGIDGTADQVARVLSGELMGMGMIPEGYRTWMREQGWCDDWRDVKEVFGE
jgi:hypothetical protein